MDGLVLPHFYSKIMTVQVFFTMPTIVAGTFQYLFKERVDIPVFSMRGE